MRQNILEVGTDLYQSMTSHDENSFEAGFDGELTDFSSQAKMSENQGNSKALINLEQEDKIIDIDDLESDKDETVFDETIFNEKSFDDYEVVD